MFIRVDFGSKMTHFGHNETFPLCLAPGTYSEVSYEMFKKVTFGFKNASITPILGLKIIFL